MAISAEIFKDFGDFQLNIELESAEGCLGILGASGCGKSMTLKCLAGIETPDKGRIVLNGRVLFDSEESINLPPRKRNVGYLFQDYALFPNMTVEENIGAGIFDKPDKKERTAEYIKKFRLEGLEKHYPAQLSGGQKQRCALARMLVTMPEMILLDEPFSAMDSYLKHILQQELAEVLAEYGKDVILVTHNRKEAFQFCQELLLMKEGRKVLQGTAQELFRHPVKVEAARLIGCKNIAEASRIDAHTLEVPEWGVRLYLEQEISGRVTHVGVLEDELKPCRDTGEVSYNHMPLRIRSKVKLPKGCQYYLENGICWTVSEEEQRIIEEKGLPEELILPEEKILLLEE